MAEFPALPLFTDSFMADTGHLDDAERGRYLHLLMLMWRAPGCRLPNDPAWLARRFNRSIEEFNETIAPIIAEFCQSDGNWITQKRLMKEFVFVTKQSRKQSARAKSRWNKEKDSCRGNATVCNAPTPTPTNKEIDTARARAAELADQIYSHMGWKALDVPPEWCGLSHTLNSMITNGYDPPLILATFERMAAAKPLKPVSYFAKMVESAHQNQIKPAGKADGKSSNVIAAADRLIAKLNYFDQPAPDAARVCGGTSQAPIRAISAR